MTLLHSFKLTAIALGFIIIAATPRIALSQNQDASLYDSPFYEHYYFGYNYNPYSGYDSEYDEDGILTDGQLRVRIRMNLAMSPFVDREDINVSVVNGVATLFGTVEDRSAMVDAIEIAYDSGAWKVHNQLDQRHRGERVWLDMTDIELMEEVKEELAWSPYVNSDRISVSVKNGVVTLYGGVENKGEIADAVENAYEAGAKRVKSKLWLESDHS